MKIEMSKAEEEEARLTAYVLGELDADETRAVEKHLEESEEARALLKEIEATAALLSAEFLKEPLLSLHEEQVEAITVSEKSEKVSRGHFMPLLAVAACASLFAAVGMKQYLAGLEGRDESHEVLAGEAPMSPASEGEVIKETTARSRASGGKRDLVMGRAVDHSDPLSVEPSASVVDEAAAGSFKEQPVEMQKRVATLHEAPVVAAPASEKEPSNPATRGAIAESKHEVADSSVRRGRSMAPIAKSQARIAPMPAPKKSKSAATESIVGDDVRLGKSKEVRNFGNGEVYGALVDNPWVSTWDDGLSTLAIDVDTGTYPNVRRFLTRRAALPPKDSVRIEEMINYFEYDYPEPDGKVPFSVNMEVASCPWAKDHRLLRVGLRGKGVDVDKRPPSNLVFLIDVSGSMRGAEKLDLLKRSMKAMVGELNEDDRIAIVTYSGSSGVALEPTHGDLKDKITAAFDKLEAGGGTNGASGITTAYSLAKSNFVEGGTNRVILATDGDFNVGVTDNGDLIQMVEQRAKQENIFLTVLGVGQGNLKEDRMEQIADKGNGSYHYLDTEKEGQKVLVRGLGATLVTVAKDVKVQLDFNPAKVAKYRLIGYANRVMPDEAFHDPSADAGEIGAGHTVTAFYEIVPAADGADVPDSPKAGSRFRERGALVKSDLTLSLALNYMLPESNDPAPTVTVPLVDPGQKWSEASEDFRFAAAVAGFGMLLRGSDYAGLLNYDLVLELGGEGIAGDGDEFGMRAEFMNLVEIAKSLSPTKE